KALKSADIAVSEADSFIRFTGCDCRTVYLAKDFTPPEIPTVRSAGEGIIKIAYLGSVNHVIDWEALAGIASGLKKRRAEVEIIGGGESLPLLLDRLNEHNICYTYHGLTFDPEQLSRVLVNCDFGFNGYKVETQVALSYKSVDYLSYSLPLLNFTGSDTQKIVEECGCGFNYTPNDLATICAKLDSVTETEMFQMRENAAAAFSNFFSYGHFKEQMDGLLEPYRT
ncbi:MAG: hypothetical protein LBQ48_07495, partial [Oscillospiraceae bacterium]|nr:hypothetical protein [Oscillospiraceae bacterium]